MRKKLSEHSWLEIVRRDSNPSDILRRLIDNANKSINDLMLLVDKLPDDKQAEIFRYDNMDRLLRTMLRGPIHDSGDSWVNKNRVSRRAHLSSMLVTIGIQFSKMVYENALERNPTLKRATIEKLDDAIEMCEAIALKAYSHPLSSYSSGLVFLFNWNNITNLESTNHERVKGDDNIELVRYINNEISGLVTISIKVHEELISCHLVNREGVDRDCQFDLDEEQKNVIVNLYDSSSPEVISILEKSLVLKRKGKDLNVYRQAEFWEVD
ncbi:MAG: hypothetical protein WA941_05895 [Nitrososphaeraceae archaeon]